MVYPLILAFFSSSHPQAMLISRSLLTISLLIPLSALALEIAPATFYTDVRPTSSDAAGINLLTRVGAVQGVADHRFAPSRPVNRAEFLKMAMLSLPVDRQIDLTADDCFPDVKKADWFSPYVCAAKNAGIVVGLPYPLFSSIGPLFDPAGAVRYDAALKILTLLYGYEIIGLSPGTDWGEPFYRAAVSRGTDLPVTISFASPLSRGQTARLAGGFLAEYEGQLEQYRLAEAGEFAASSASSDSSSSSSSVSSASSLSSSSSVTSVPSVPSAPPLFSLPSVSHFLLVGNASDAIADFVVPSRSEAGEAAHVRVTLTREARSIDRLELRTARGDLVAILRQRTTTDIVDYKETYESPVTTPGTFVLPAGSDARLVIVAVIRTTTNNGFADDLVQVRSVTMTLRTVITNQSVNLAFTGPFPKHQTSLAKILTVTSASPVGGALESGTGKTLGSFLLTGTGIAARSPSLTQLTFALKRMGQVSLSSVLLRSPNGNVPCTINGAGDTISCPGLGTVPDAFSLASPLNATLSATIVLPAGTGGRSLLVTLADAGSPETIGSVHWTDGSAEYRWIEGSSPVASGIDLRRQ
jgi:hypothetical protein